MTTVFDSVLLGELGHICISIWRRLRLCNVSFSPPKQELISYPWPRLAPALCLCAFPSIPANHASLHIQCHLHSQIINTVVLTHALLSASSAQQTFLLHGHWQMASHLSKFRAHVTFPRNTFLTHPKMNCSFSPLQPSRFLLCHLHHFVAFICHCVSLLSY